MKTWKILRINSFITFFALLLLFGAVEASATTYYVATTGSDSNPGTEGSPFKTIQRAANTVSAGDTVYVRAGTYPNFQCVNLQGTSGSPITFREYPGEDVIIDRYMAGGGSSNNIIKIVGNSQYLIFDGFELIDSDPLYDYLRSLDLYNPNHLQIIKNSLNPHNGQRYGVRFLTSSTGDPSYITIRNMEIHHLMEQAIQSGYGVHHLTIENNHIHHNGYPRSGYGMYIWGTNHTIKNNIIHDNAGLGCKINVANSTFQNNLVYNNGLNPWLHMSQQVVKNHGYGMKVWCCGGGNVFYNNTVYNNRDVGLSDTSSNTTIINNISFGHTTNLESSGATIITNLIGTDPLFVNTVAGKFQVQSGSPAIDAGTTITEITTDIEGNPRPLGFNYDIGAYEYVSGNPDTQAPSVPANLSATAISESQIDLSWTASTDNVGVTSYKIYRDGIQVATTANTTYSDTGLAESTTYTYTVSAYDAAGNESGQSASSQATTNSDTSQNTIISARTLAPITIDGDLSEPVWNQANYVTFSNPSRSDNQVKVYTLYDANNLYFAYEVTDSSLEAQNVSLWRDDGAEIYLDTQNNKSTSMDQNDYHFTTNINNQTSGGTVTVKTKTNTNGYTQEIAIPWATINVSPSSNKTMGLLLGNNDRDNGQSSQFDWLNLIETGSYARPNLWGQMSLSSQTVGTSSDTTPPAPPSGLSIQ